MFRVSASLYTSKAPYQCVSGIYLTLVFPALNNMGPIALFDKSFLQSLSLNESVWFDHYFMANICPLFYVETLADLQKNTIRKDRTPEQEVAIIAEKTPETSGAPNVHHRELCILNLMGHDVPMTGRIPIAGGRPVKSGGKAGFVYNTSPEAQAFTRWQKGQFKDVERLHARAWRDMLSTLDLTATAETMRAVGIDSKSCKSLEHALTIAKDVVHANANPFEQMKLVFLFLDLPPELCHPILERWSINQYRPLSSYAPYAAHVLTVELFFQIALAAKLIATERPSNRADIAYLFYLPFCMLFVSTDNLHKRCAPLFLRSNQDFVWGADLKTELHRINDHFSSLPEQVRETGIIKFARQPIGENTDLLIRLWDRHAPGWRRSKDADIPVDREKQRALVEDSTSSAMPQP
jgi:hypothetical protein